MLRNFHILTVTHRNTAITNLKQFFTVQSNGIDEIQRIGKLKERFDIEELFYTATCNRALYMMYTEQEVNADFILSFFQAINSDVTIEDIYDNVDAYHGQRAVEHLLKVCSSLDSLVVGEREILGQIKTAYANARVQAMIGDNLRLLLDRAVTCGKRVFTSTRIGEKPVSVVSLAFTRFAQEVSDKQGNIFMIGAGQTNYLMSKFLSKNEFNNVHIFNRTKEKADKLAETFGWLPYGLDELDTTDKLPSAIILSTSSPVPLVSRELIEKASEKGKVLIIDLSVPANVPDVSDLDQCQLITIEDLRLLADKNLEFRRAEIDRCEEIVEDELQIFRLLYKERVIERALRPIPTEIKNVKQNALEVVFKDRFEHLDQESKDLVMDMLNYMEKKCIAIPMKATKKALLNGDAVSSKVDQGQTADPA